MPSFKTGLRNSSYRVNRRSGKEGAQGGDPEARLTDFERRGSSLPANCSSVNIMLLPSLRHSSTDPDIWTPKTIPKDVIETVCSDQQNSSADNRVADEMSADRNTQSQKEFNISNQTTITETTSCVQLDVCRDLQKTLLDGLGQRVISHRGGGSSGVGSSYNLLLNADLLDRISMDIVRMSAHEPSGLSGCRLRTRVERQDSADMDLGCVRVDRDAKETFEIVLSLRERRLHGEPSGDKHGRQGEPSGDKHGRQTPRGVKGNGVASLLSSVFGGQSANRGRVRAVEVLVSDAYQLEKIKLRRFDDEDDITSNVGLCSSPRSLPINA